MQTLLCLFLCLFARQDTPLAIQNVTLIDVHASSEDAARLGGQTVLMRGDKIVALGSADEVPLPADARLIDGKGKFLIPGLFDMHVHLSSAEESSLTLMALAGVTSARDLGGDLEVLDARLKRVQAGELLGPRVARAGYVLERKSWLKRVLQMWDGNEETRASSELLARTRIGIETEDEAMDAVARVLESGAEVLKFRNTPKPSVFAVLMEEAQLAGLRVAGHEPNTVGLLQSVRMGMGSLEHTPVMTILNGTSAEEWQEIYAAMVEHDVHLTPTFVANLGRRLTADQLEESLQETRKDARWASLPKALKRGWEESVTERRMENSSLDWVSVLDTSRRISAEMHAAGVPMLAGTDLGVTRVYPGTALHEELGYLVAFAGLTPLEALQAATQNPARWLGWERILGSISLGKRADMVLLDADPLLDISHVGRIHTVIARGVPFGPQQRAALTQAIIQSNSD